MKNKRILLGMSLVLLLTGCTLKLPLPFRSSNSSSQSSSSSGSNTHTGWTSYNSNTSSQGGNSSSSSSQGGSSSSSSSSQPDLPDDVTAYYSSISDSLTGTNLRNALNTLNNKKRKRTMGYGGHKTYLKYTERADGVPSNKMVGFYDNTLVSADWDNQATWNREHVWPNSLGGGSVEGDIHMVRPASVKINSERGNKYYGKSIYDPGQYVEAYRGIAARIIFYCAIANKNLSVIDANSGGSTEMGKLSDLLEWNLQYAPSTDPNATLELRVEQNRNNVIYSNEELQGNRNPFIDHPEYACKIWGNTNANTKKICGIS